ncbi:serpin B [Hyunsoonleella jejuensis]|uniref:Serpin B n=1 Tax=Hyunsoonleella jejuensis TaxID=419940 RepID=A0A1H9IWQ7_9FLAO|nr:serpin family protein [Hyunsoonleella jejuensis]SEQ79231.1 serpin B [Hyunsoonleella jejuensis]
MNYKPIVILVIIFLIITYMGPLHAQNSDTYNSLNQYAFDLYGELKEENENLLLSPLSTYYALLMAYEGANNTTRQEFENVLYIENSQYIPSKLLNTQKQLSDSLYGLKVANALWSDIGFQVDTTYRNSVLHKYGSDVHQIEFKNTGLAVSKINEWVAKNTNNRIQNILNLSDLNVDSKLVISNAVYFKGEWLKAFKKSATHKNVFFTDSINQYRTDFMNKTEKLMYFENEAFQFVAKPYKQSNLSFGIILPKDFFGLEAVESQLNDKLFIELLEDADTLNVRLSMPKIKLESQLKLKPVLKKLGLETMFNQEADFSGINRNDSLHFSQFIHKTQIDLNEEYTEAAAATVAVAYIRGIPKRKDVVADHPFMFFIFDNYTRSILFIGRFTKPQNGELVEEDEFSTDLVQRIINEIKPNKRTSWSYTQPLTVIVDGKDLIAVDLNDIDFDDVEDIKNYKVDAIQLASKGYEGLIAITLKKGKTKKLKRKITK